MFNWPIKGKLIFTPTALRQKIQNVIMPTFTLEKGIIMQNRNCADFNFYECHIHK